MMEAGVTIERFGSKDLLKYPGGGSYKAENLCISCAKACGIGPVARHLFGLWWPDQKVWLSPCKDVDTSKGQRWLLLFKLRFKPPSMQRIIGLKDPAAFNYYFHQMRSDFLSDNIPEILPHKNKALGLAATDMIRVMLEKKLSIDEMRRCYKDFLPHGIWKKYKDLLRQPLMEAVEKGWANSKQKLEFVKGQYMAEVFDLAPNYGSEQFTAQIDEDGQVWQVTIQIQPYNAEQPGLRMQTKGSKEKWTHVCSIADLYYVSIRNDGTVELSRRNGIPKYFRFESVSAMHSFVSCLDGYYRFMEKWTFNLCKELATPSLLELRALKCHGPAGYLFSCAKLKEKQKNEAGSFLIRESSSRFEEFRVDWCRSSDEKPQTVEIEQSDDNLFRFIGEEQGFPTLMQLLLQDTKHHFSPPLTHCVPPSEYDKTQLLLCRPDDQKEKEKTLSECSCTNKCIPSQTVVFHQEHQLRGRFSLTCPGHLKRTGGEFTPVMVKSLLSHLDAHHMQEFLKHSSRVLHWQNEALVSTLGVILCEPLALVMEYLPLGSLDHYLQQYSDEVKQVDLIEAASYLARALWYLEEHGCVHGKIRCRNVMVASHTDNSFKVKLSDPGLLFYSCLDDPWIPPECLSECQSAATSAAADVWAFGTTLWEIFSNGKSPDAFDSQMVPDQGDSYFLPPPSGCHPDVVKLMFECWALDPYNRKLPQAIMRDINQILYEVYNSRRSHSYATVYPHQPSAGSPRLPSTPLPPTANRNRQQQHSVLPFSPKHNILKTVTRLVKPISNNFSYDQMSAYSSSSDQSIVTMLSDADSYHGDRQVPVGSLISFGSCDSGNRENSGGDLQGTLIETMDGSPWVIDPSHLKMGQILGQGFYGEVCKATLTQFAGLKEETVAVKSIKKTVLSEAGLTDLLREIDIMKSLRHKNIVEIKGLVEEPQPMLVMEYLELGSLLAHLQMYKKKLTTNRLIQFATDIAQGMQYLEQMNIVHRDLASRNILVASQSQVKISDFGLAQFTENHYYRVKSERNLPVRWYSPESIKFGKFSHKSDVWSYGVTLWEMFSFGENPVIPGVTDNNLSQALETGRRLACPQNCPVDVYRLMGHCWQADSHIRPSFQDILLQLADLNYDMIC